MRRRVVHNNILPLRPPEQAPGHNNLTSQCRWRTSLATSSYCIPEKHVSRSVVFQRRTLPNGLSSMAFHIPWLKTTKNDHLDIVCTDNGEPSFTVTALEHHLNNSAGLPDDAPLFAFRAKEGVWSLMTRDLFLGRQQPPVSYRSLLPHRGATELLLRGVPPEVVATQESWKSSAFPVYWRNIESVLPLSITDTFCNSRAKFVKNLVLQLLHNFPSGS